MADYVAYVAKDPINQRGEASGGGWGGNTMRNWAPANWLDRFERQEEGEGQGDSTGSL